MALSLKPEERWNSWDFDRNLTIVTPRPIPTDKFSSRHREVTREGLETVLFTNLETVFPDWKLRRLTPTAQFVETSTFAAVEPTGVLHLFALRDVREAPTAISDVVPIALTRGATEIRRWLDRGDDRRWGRWLAARIAAFWLDVQARTDVESTFDHLAADEASIRKIDNLVERLDARTSTDEVIAAATGLLDSWNVAGQDSARWPSAPAGVHLHLIVGDSAELDGQEVELLQRMRNNGLRVDVWEVRLDAARDHRDGRLAMRAARFPDRRQKQFPALQGRRPTELLAEMAYQRPDLRDASPSWELVRNKHRTTLQTRLPIIDEPCEGPFFGFTSRGDEIEFKVSLTIPDHINEAYSLTDLKTQVTPAAMRAVRAWIAELLPPDPAEDPEASRRLEHFLHHTKKWGGYLRMGQTGPVVVATGWHSGGLRSATIAVDTSEMTPSIEELATLANELVDTFIGKLLAEGAEPDGWTPPQEQ